MPNGELGKEIKKEAARRREIPNKYIYTKQAGVDKLQEFVKDVRSLEHNPNSAGAVRELQNELRLVKELKNKNILKVVVTKPVGAPKKLTEKGTTVTKVQVFYEGTDIAPKAYRVYYKDGKCSYIKD